MAVEELGIENSVEHLQQLATRDPIECTIPENEKHHLFHQVGAISRYIRDHFIFPLISKTDPYSKEILKREDWFSNDLFWNSPYPDLRFPRHEQIKQTFDRYEQDIVIREAGKEIKLKCRIIETKDASKSSKEDVLNHLIVQGNISTLNNNMPGVYPFLSSYLEEKERNPQMKPARFIVLTHYHHTVKDLKTNNETTYLPGDIDEWMYVFKKTVEAVVDRYGQLEMMTGHSLGTLPVVGHLMHVNDEEFKKLFPRTLFLSQGPSSVEKVTKKIPLELESYPWGWTTLGLQYIVGKIVYYITKYSGWDISLDQILTERFSKLPQNDEIAKKLKQCKVIVSEVDNDYYFPDKASLCSSDKLENVDDRITLYRLTFNPPLSWGVKRGQHNFNLGLLQRRDLIKEKLHFQGIKTVHLDSPEAIVEYENQDHPVILRHGESLVDAVLRSTWSQSCQSIAPSLESRVTRLAV